MGHTSELVRFIGRDPINKVIMVCIEKNISIYAFDNDFYDFYVTNGGNLDKFFTPQISIEHVPFENKSKLFSLNTPVLGILGTDSKQGKFTLQLELRKRFKNEGFSIGQLGSEPSSMLFGFDFTFPMGFNSNVAIRSFEAITTLNKLMHEIEKKIQTLLLLVVNLGQRQRHFIIVEI